MRSVVSGFMIDHALSSHVNSRPQPIAFAFSFSGFALAPQISGSSRKLLCSVCLCVCAVYTLSSLSKFCSQNHVTSVNRMKCADSGN